jgi:hypothetical protein
LHLKGRQAPVALHSTTSLRLTLLEIQGVNTRCVQDGYAMVISELETELDFLRAIWRSKGPAAQGGGILCSLLTPDYCGLRG